FRSQPSIHLPTSVYLPSAHTASPAFRRFSFGAKNSSFAASTAPPRRSAARSTRSVKSVIALPCLAPRPARAGLSAQQPTTRRSDDFPVPINRFSPQQGPPDDAGERPPGVRRDFVAMMEPSGVHLEARLGIPDRQIGIVSRRD